MLTLLATVMSVTWASTGVLARLTDSAAVDANTFTTAASFCPAPTTLTANADAYLVESNSGSGSPPDEEHGSSGFTDLFVWSASGDRRWSLVNFALPTVPAGCTITSATLAFTTISGTTGRTLTATRAQTTWNESTVTWNTKPAVTGSSATTSSTATVNEVVSFSVTSQVLAMYPSSAFGFMIKDSLTSGSGQQRYHSRTGTAGKLPTLTVVMS